MRESTPVLLESAHAAPVLVPPPGLAPTLARSVLGGGLLAGTVGAVMFAQEGGGVGVALYLLVLSAGVGLFSRDATRARAQGVTSLLIAGAFFALLLLFRRADTLAVANTMAALFFITLASAFAKPGATRSLLDTRVRDLLALVPTGIIEAVSGAPRFLFGDARAAFLTRDGRSTSATAIAITRAVALGVLLTVIFGLLLSGGDPVFRSLIIVPNWWGTLDVPGYLVRFGFFACPALALMWSTTRASAAPTDLLADGITLNRLDVVVALSSLNGLFGVYLLLQLRVLFGGSAYVLATTGLTVAQYARSGFFALTVAAGLVLTVLLGLNALLRSDRLGSWAVSRRLSTSLLVMVGLMLTSATTRMMLYVQSFGITMDRIVALAVMAWLAMTGVWFTLTVLRERTTRFVIGAVVAGSVTLAALNLLNPERIVVQSAVSRATAGGAFDAAYMQQQLGSDAVPALVEALRLGVVSTALPAPVTAVTPVTPNCAIARTLLVRWGDAAANSLGSWTFSAARAARVVSRNRALLLAQCAGA